MLQKIIRCGVQERPTWNVGSARNPHEATIQKHLHNPVNGHAAHGLDVRARHGLSVGNDRKRLQRWPAEARWLSLWVEAAYPRSEFGARD